MTANEAIIWARTADAGEYLARYDLAVDSDDSSCGFGDDTLAAVERELGKRGLTLTATSIGLRVE